jgi:hypothetical protein
MLCPSVISRFGTLADKQRFDAASAMGHVWTAPPWQLAAALVGCGHVSGLFVRR